MTDFCDKKDEFARIYMKNLFEDTLPKIKEYEAERKIRYTIALIIASIIIIFALILLIYAIFDFDSIINKVLRRAVVLKFYVIGIISLVVWLWNNIQSTFEFKLKNKMMPVLISSFDGFKWRDEASEEFYNSVINSAIFPFFPNKKFEHAYIDYFYGSYNNVHMDFAQGYYSTKNIFKAYDFSGGVIRIQMNKNFSGITILRPKKVFFNELIQSGLEQVILEDKNFNDQFNILSTDQVESRYILTPTFMEKLKNISVKFADSKDVYCAFYDNYIYIAFPSKTRVFNLFGLSKRVDDVKIFHKLFSQIASVIDLINYLKLDLKIGL